ncbi:MAG: triose-phosphate isomerase [Pseudomonadota bacterium]|nr:triose-phosphate isomerase [Pseudomonadota bacterium]
MRKSLIAANWKCHGSLLMVDEFANALTHHKMADVVVFPPAVFVERFANQALNTVDCGVQDIGVAESGAYTGEVAGEMAREAGAKWVIIGHSERRNDQQESDELIAQKLLAANRAELRPILCVGETQSQREDGHALAVVEQQLLSAVAKLDLSQISIGAIAYEPVWAIGTGLTATPQQAQDMHKGIRELLRQIDEHTADETRIIYGGSVKPDNAASLFSQPDIDGALVGGASLQLDTFMEIIAAA